MESQITAGVVGPVEGFQGEAKLWKISRPVKIDESDRMVEYIVSSAVSAMFTGPETYLFSADEKGEVLNWGELPGSYRGDFDHQEAMQGFLDCVNKA